MTIKIQIETTIEHGVTINGTQPDMISNDQHRYQLETILNSQSTEEKLIQIKITHTKIPIKTTDIITPKLNEDQIQEYKLSIEATMQGGASIPFEVKIPARYLEIEDTNDIRTIKSKGEKLEIPYFMNKSNFEHLQKNQNELVTFIFHPDNEEPITIEMPFKGFQNY